MAPTRSTDTWSCCLSLLWSRLPSCRRRREFIHCLLRTRNVRRVKPTQRSKIAALTFSVQNKEMAPIYFLAVILTMALAGNEAHSQSMKLMARPSDGAALCAMDPPTTSARMSDRMAGTPEVVRCGMTCTSDAGCKHFNYVSTESDPCQLYHYRPTNFDVSPNCQHYYTPGLQTNFSD